MQFSSASQPSWSTAKLPMPMTLPAPARGQVAHANREICGWFDSSFDLAAGLEVSEQDDQTLYQLWELSRR